MAQYGTGGTGIPFTGFTPTLGVDGANNGVQSGAIQRNGLMQQDTDINRAFVTQGNRITQALMLALIGAVAGGTALAIKVQVVGSSLSADSTGAQGGGVVPIQTVTLINRPTTAQDVTNLKTLVSFSRGPSTYVQDVSGNGGGSRLGW